MLEKIFHNTPHSAMDVVMGWRWATDHPNLYAAIEILSQPYVLVIALIVASRLASNFLFGRGTKR